MTAAVFTLGSLAARGTLGGTGYSVERVAEAIIALVAAIAAASIALLGFALDSLIEVFAAGVVLWQLRRGEQHREERALKLIGLSFFALAIYVCAESVRKLILAEHPGETLLGIVVTALSLLVMPALAAAKHRVGHAINSRSLIADAAETWLCAVLSAVVLAGLALHSAFDWWWADPVGTRRPRRQRSDIGLGG